MEQGRSYRTSNLSPSSLASTSNVQADAGAVIADTRFWISV